jgi:hypothetical protein
MDWHQKIFPAVTILIVALSVVFIAFSLQQFTRISAYLQTTPEINVQPIIARVLGVNNEALEASLDSGNYLPQWAALLELEVASLKKRHHQASALLASRLWTRYLAVFAGIVMVTVGSILIMAKLQEPANQIEGEASSVKLRVASASPGLLLCMMGCILILVAVLHNPIITLQDGRVYMGNESSPVPGVAQ